MAWYGSLLEVLVLITIPIYVTVLLMLWRNRRDPTLGSPFFAVFIAVGLSDIFVALQKACCVQAPEEFFYEAALNSKVMATVCLATQRHAGTAQCFGTVLLAFNRFTAIVFPLRYKSLWSSSFIAKIVAFQWFAPFVFSGAIITFLVPVHYQNNSLNAVIDSVEYNKVHNIVAITANVLFILAIVIFSVVTLFMLRKIVTASLSQRELNEAKTERNLTIVSIVHSLIYLGFGAAIFLMVFSKMISLPFVIYTIFSNLLTFVNPYFLLMVSKKVRSKWLQFLLIQKRSPRVGTIQNSSVPRSGAGLANPVVS